MFCVFYCLPLVTVYSILSECNKSLVVGTNVPQLHCIEKLCTHVYISFYYYHWVDTTAGGLLVPDGIIRPVVSASAQTWFIKYIYY
jgi:hypothetical protein